MDGLDLCVARGTVQGVLGPNGAGKTTLVRVLSTLLRADSGRVEVAGCDVTSQARAVRFRMGLLGQHAALDEELGGRQNLEMFGRLHHLGARRARVRADELLERFDLADTGRRAVRAYSGGMRRRLDLAASLVTAPEVLFLDEPTTGLDPRGRAEVWAAVRSLVGGGTTVLLTTQYLEEADQLADRVSVVDRGRVIADGTPDELKSRVGVTVSTLFCVMRVNWVLLSPCCRFLVMTFGLMSIGGCSVRRWPIGCRRSRGLCGRWRRVGSMRRMLLCGGLRWTRCFCISPGATTG